jgi:hypothetical protein
MSKEEEANEEGESRVKRMSSWFFFNLYSHSYPFPGYITRQAGCSYYLFTCLSHFTVGLMNTKHPSIHLLYMIPCLPIIIPIYYHTNLE